MAKARDQVKARKMAAVVGGTKEIGSISNELLSSAANSRFSVLLVATPATPA